LFSRPVFYDVGKEALVMKIGELRIDPVFDGAGRFPPTKSFRGTTPEQWAIHQDLLDEDGMLGFAMGGYLVRSPGRTVLVDLGLGPRSMMGITGGAFLADLARLGVAPGEVSDVVFTHLHADHIGWASDEGRAVFASATYRCATADWQHFMVDHRGEEAEILEPVTSHFAMWSGGGTILPGIDIQEAPGHTPGSSIIVLSSGTERALLLGDVVHCPVELLDDEWAGLADVDPELALRTRRALTREMEGTDVPMAAAHFPGLQFGRLLRAEGRRRWVV
jgi:glyoxylase-like metal-dependent hydrolase (beta-lactamase superfamily II)